MCEREVPADGIRWSEGFNGDRPKFIPVVAPKPFNPVSGWILSDAVLGVMLHWAMGRTTPHYEAPVHCEACAHKFPMRWYGYLAIWLPGIGRWALAEITKFAALQNRMLANPAVKLRGRTGAVLAEITERTGAGALPEAFDVKSALRLLWLGADRDGLEKGG
jgi:hypothetical protein